jgi:hypothetical protein
MPVDSAHRRHGRHSHRRNRISLRHQRWLYLCGSLLSLSGAGWLIGHYALRGEELVSEGAPHFSEMWWMRLHGAALLGFLIAFGALLPRHVTDGWRHRANRGSGAFMIITVTALTLTGYGLYYAGGDTFRQWVSVVHWAVGLMSIAALLWHIVRGRRRSW